MGDLRTRFRATKEPLRTVERKIGATNVGLYCSACSEFIALAVEPEGSTQTIEVTAYGPIRIECPYCQHQQYRHVANVRHLRLTAASTRRWPAKRQIKSGQCRPE